MKVLLFVVAALASTQVEAAQRFNLNCSGTQTNYIRNVPQDPKPYNSTYRIDLDANKWCEDECKVPNDIYQVSPTMLYLDKTLPDAANSMIISRTVFREDGTEQTHIAMGSIEIDYKGKCQVSGFTGFPEVKTAF